MRSIGAPTLLLLGGLWSSVAIAMSPPRPTPPSDIPDAAIAASKLSTAPAAPLSEWKQWLGGWVRLEHDGNLSCLSFDATHCAWSHEVADPTAFPEQQLRPLVCGKAHQRSEWQVNGYNDEKDPNGDRHWCRSAHATLFAKWQDYSVLGASHWLSETPAGDAMCHSTDGMTCTPVTPGESAPPLTGEVHPLVCGAHHRRMKGNDGYDQPDHWCATPKIDEDFGQQAATGDWTQIKAKGWAHVIEPAMLVRAKVPAGRSLTLRAQAMLNDSVVYRRQELPKAFFGLEFGKQLRLHLGGESVEPPASWKPMAASNDDVIVGMTVTPRGNACFFGANGGPERQERFFADANFLGSTREILDDAQRPIQFKFSSLDWMKSLSLVDWRADAGPRFAIEKVLMLYARFVPVEGDDTGKKRPIYYAAHCDQP